MEGVHHAQGEEMEVLRGDGKEGVGVGESCRRQRRENTVQID